ncbi:MAG: tetratricopeptide repeat protein [bacterium]
MGIDKTRATVVRAALAAGLAALLLGAGASRASEAGDQARELLAGGDAAAAKTLLVNALSQSPRDHDAAAVLARVYMREQDYDNAAKCAEKAVKLADSVPEYHLWLARASLGKTMKSGMVGAFMSARKGKSEYEKTIALDPANAEARFELCMYYLIAPGMVGGSKDKARDQATALEGMSPLYGSYAWAGYWEREQQIAKAESLYNRAVGLDTSSTATALYGLGYFYERNQKLDQAGAVFKQITENRPADLVALFNLGRVYTNAKTNLDDAEAAFRRYLREGPASNGPDAAAAHYRLGIVYDLKDMPDSAAAELRQAVALAPDVKQYKDTLKDVEKKRN